MIHGKFSKVKWRLVRKKGEIPVKDLANSTQDKEIDMIARLFLHHPRQVDESYLEHAIFAGRIALRMLGAATAAFVHALIPAMFEKTASRIVLELSEEMRERGN